jgi:hypothetical protein
MAAALDSNVAACGSVVTDTPLERDSVVRRASTLVNAVWRADTSGGAPERIIAAMHAAVADTGCNVTRLWMLDYRRIRAADATMPAPNVAR